MSAASADSDGDSAAEESPVLLEHAEPSTSSTFRDCGVGDWLVKQCKELGLTSPTAVQLNCVPQALRGRDVLGCSKTGTGKTLAFALPILHSLARDPYGVYALIITPTRELAFQIADQFKVLGRPIGLKDAVIVGGRDMVEQSKDLHRRPHVVVATPGRLADHIDSHGNPEDFTLFGKLRFLVLDEGDRLLDGQYASQLKTIFGALPTQNQRQTLLFSATITDALSRLKEISMDKGAYFFQDKDEIITVDKLDQRYVLCPVDVKDAYLVYVVKNFHEKHPDSSVLVFAHTCRECQALAVMFRSLGFHVGSLHSQIPQFERMQSLARFRSGKQRILICTDVASRGLDIPRVELVVNHNVPQSPKAYVHRVGRSARAGRYGAAITFVTQYDVSLLKAVEALIKVELNELKVSAKKVSRYVTEVLVAKREAEITLDQQHFGEKRETNRRKQMLLEGLAPEAVDAYMDEQKRRRVAGARSRMDAVTKRVDRLDTNAVHRVHEGRKKAKRLQIVKKVKRQNK